MNSVFWLIIQIIGLGIFAGGVVLCGHAYKNNSPSMLKCARLPITAGYLLVWIGAIGMILTRFLSGF